MLWAISFFILDYLSFSLFNGWFIYSLLSYFIIKQFQAKNFKDKAVLASIFLILIQDSFINGRFGISLVYIIPIIILAYILNKLIISESIKIFYFLFLVIAIILDQFIIKTLILSQNITLNSTLFKISINLIVEIFIFLGIRGNRSLLAIGK